MPSRVHDSVSVERGGERKRVVPSHPGTFHHTRSSTQAERLAKVAAALRKGEDTHGHPGVWVITAKGVIHRVRSFRLDCTLESVAGYPRDGFPLSRPDITLYAFPTIFPSDLRI